MGSITYNYAIVGAGCAGIHLVLAMIEDSFFEDKQIIVFEKDSKSFNDKTWCYWEVGEGLWDHLIHHSWSRGQFYSSTTLTSLDMDIYSYKMLRSIDFYNYAKKRIKDANNVRWVSASVNEIKKEQSAIVLTDNESYLVDHVFDSRIDPSFFNNEDSFTRLLQHFKGWVIQTEKDFFDPDEFIMMDFRQKWNDSASFNYVLPTSKREALVEFTLFTPELIEDESYDEMLNKYLSETLGLTSFKVLETEQGIIPMSDFPFHLHHDHHVTKIGTAGSWVRPSSGYSFKNAEKYSRKITANLKAGKPPSAGVANNRFRKYDSLLLDILYNRNELGEELFSSMFAKNNTNQIFKFLDEETNLAEEIRIMSSFRSSPFLKALYNQIIR